jgi:hypothetical protein
MFIYGRKKDCQLIVQYRFLLYIYYISLICFRYPEAQEAANSVLQFDNLNADAIFVRGLCLYYEVRRKLNFFISIFRILSIFDRNLDLVCKYSSIKSSVADPNPDPPDPHVFGPPGSGSTSQIRIRILLWIRILLSSCKNSKKNLDS